MGVGAVRVPRASTAGPGLRLNRRRGRGPRRTGAATPSPAESRPGIEPWIAMQRAVPVERKTFWEMLQDDRELVGLKVVLLTTLLILAAFLELVA